MIDLLEFNVRGDERGLLVAIEENKEVPFNVKRVFYIYATKAGVPRGRHAHYHTKQLLVAVNGSCKVTLDDGIAKKTFDLDKPSVGLFQDSMIWGTMHDFSEDCVLMVLASELYDESDYIKDYDDFLRETNKK